MTLLVVDTATSSCGVGILEEGRVLAEQHRDDGQTHSRHLMTMIDSVLDRCRMAVSDLAAVAVTVGPGSFTGLRIGLAAAKGLAVSASIPLAGVITLEALARQVPDAPLVCPLIDARKGEVYGGLFRPDPGGRPRLQGDMFVRSPEEALEAIDEKCLLIGDGALLYRDRIRKRLGGRMVRFAPEGAHRIQPATVGRIAQEALTAGAPCDPNRLSPVYIRKSDAELKLGTARGFH